MVSRLIRVNGLVLLCALIVWHQFASVAYAQFTTILNIPPDPDIGDNQSIDSNTQLNLSDGVPSVHNSGQGLRMDPAQT